MGVPVIWPSGRPAWFTQYKMWSHCRGDDQQTENHTTVNTHHMATKYIKGKEQHGQYLLFRYSKKQVLYSLWQYKWPRAIIKNQEHFVS
jgi:hypothetical protein